MPRAFFAFTNLKHKIGYTSPLLQGSHKQKFTRNTGISRGQDAASRKQRSKKERVLIEVK